MIDFTDQVAVVTGASSGIGKAIALELAAYGATLCLVGRRLGVLEAVANSAHVSANKTRCYRVDLTNAADIESLSDRIKQDFAQLHILIHSAGEYFIGSIENSPIEDLDRLFRINVRAPYALTQIFLPMLKEQKGQIVFINSSVGLMKAKANLGQYSASKHALRAITDSLRAEVNADGVRVMSIYPGRTATPMQALVHKMEGKPYNPERLMQTKDVASVVINALSLPRSAEVTDLSLRPFIKT